jgi:hypothetical protein
VSAGNAEIYATNPGCKVRGRPIYIYEVQNRSIKKHCLEEAS